MKDVKKIKKYQEAEKDYVLGMSIPEISRKYSVKEATVKTWIKRHRWKRTEIQKKSDKQTEIIIDGKNLYQIRREELLNQLEIVGKKNIQSIIEIESYIDSLKDYYKYKNDLDERGHLIETKKGIKHNESATLKTKSSNERRKILEFLGLNDIITVKEEDDDEEL